MIVSLSHQIAGDGGPSVATGSSEKKPLSPPTHTATTATHSTTAPDTPAEDWRGSAHSQPPQGTQKAKSPERKASSQPHPYSVYPSYHYYGDPYSHYPMYPPPHHGMPPYGFHPPPPVGPRYGGHSERGGRRHTDRDRDREETKRHDFHPWDRESRRKWSEDKEPRPKLLMKDRDWRDTAVGQEKREKSLTPEGKQANDTHPDPVVTDSAHLVSLVTESKDDNTDNPSPPTPTMRSQPKKIMLRKMSDSCKADSTDKQEKADGAAAAKTSDVTSSEAGKEKELSEAPVATSAKSRQTAWKVADRSPVTTAKTLYEPEGKKSEAKFRKYQHDARVGSKREKTGLSPVTTPSDTNPPAHIPDVGGKEKGSEKVPLKRTVSGDRGREGEGRRGRGGERHEEESQQSSEPRRNQSDHSGPPRGDPHGGRRDRIGSYKEPRDQSKVHIDHSESHRDRGDGHHSQQHQAATRRPSHDSGRPEWKGRRERGSQSDRRSRGSETDSVKEESNREQRPTARTRAVGETKTVRTDVRAEEGGGWGEDELPSPGGRRRRQGEQEMRKEGRHGRTQRLGSREEDSKPKPEQKRHSTERRHPPADSASGPRVTATTVPQTVVNKSVTAEQQPPPVTQRDRTPPTSHAPPISHAPPVSHPTTLPSGHTRPPLLPNAPPPPRRDTARETQREGVRKGKREEVVESRPNRRSRETVDAQRKPDKRRGVPEGLRGERGGRGGRRGSQRGRREDDNQRKEQVSAPLTNVEEILGERGHRDTPGERGRGERHRDTLTERGRGDHRDVLGERGRGERHRDTLTERGRGDHRDVLGERGRGERHRDTLTGRGDHRDVPGERGRGEQSGRERRERTRSRLASGASDDAKPPPPRDDDLPPDPRESRSGKDRRRRDRERDRDRERGSRKPIRPATEASQRPPRREQKGNKRGADTARPTVPVSAPEKRVGYSAFLEDIESGSDWEEESQQEKAKTGADVLCEEPATRVGSRTRESRRGGRQGDSKQDQHEPVRSEPRSGAGRGRGRGRGGEQGGGRGRQGGRPGSFRRRPGREVDVDDVSHDLEHGTGDTSETEKQSVTHKQQEFAKYDLTSTKIAIVDDIGGHMQSEECTVEFVEVTSKKTQKEKVKKEREEQWRLDSKEELKKTRKPAAAKMSEQTSTQLSLKPSTAWTSSGKAEEGPQASIWSSPTAPSTDWNVMLGPVSSATGGPFKDPPSWSALTASAAVGVIGEGLQVRPITTARTSQTDKMTATSGYSLFPVEHTLSSLISAGPYGGGGAMLNAAVNLKLSQEHLPSPSGEPQPLMSRVDPVSVADNVSVQDKEHRKRAKAGPPVVRPEPVAEGDCTGCGDNPLTSRGEQAKSGLPPRLQSNRSTAGSVGRGRGATRGRKGPKRGSDSGERREQDVPGEKKKGSQQHKEQKTQHKVTF